MFDNDPDSLVVLTTVANLQEAAIYRSLIESEGIHVEMGDEAITTTLPYFNLLGASAGVKLLVLQKDVQRACDILQKSLTVSKASAAERETTSSDPNRAADRAGMVALIAIFFPPVIFVSFYLLIATWVRHHQSHRFNRKRFWKNAIFTLVVGGIAVLVMVSLVIPYLVEARW